MLPFVRGGKGNTDKGLRENDDHTFKGLEVVPSAWNIKWKREHGGEQSWALVKGETMMGLSGQDKV